MINYALWDLKDEFTLNEAACLWFDVDPSEHPWFESTPEKTKRDIKLMIEILQAAVDKRKITGCRIERYLDETDYLAQLEDHMSIRLYLKRAGLKDYAQGIGQKTLFLFPEERERKSNEANPKGDFKPKEEDCKTWDLKDDWKIRDFTKWRVEKEFNLDEAAYLYCEVDPALDGMRQPVYPFHTYLASAIDHEAAFHKRDPYKYPGPLPNDEWERIKDICNLLLKAAKNGSLLTQKSGKANRDDLRIFFVGILGERPRFLFPDDQDSRPVQTTQNEDKAQADFDGFIQGVKISYESDNEISIQTPKQKARCFNHEPLGFRNVTTREWKTLLDILQTPGLIYAFGPANTYSEDGANKIKKSNPEYSAARKRIEAISKKLVDFFEKHYKLSAPENYKVYEALPGMAGMVRLKFKKNGIEQVLASNIDGGYNGYWREDILENLKKLANDKTTPNDYLAERIKEAKLKGVTKGDLENILPPSRSALLS